MGKTLPSAPCFPPSIAKRPLPDVKLTVPLDLNINTHRIAWARFEAEREVEAEIAGREYAALPVDDLVLVTGFDHDFVRPQQVVNGYKRRPAPPRPATSSPTVKF